MRIIMLGTGPFAVPTLRALVGRHDVLLVVSRPPHGRNAASSPLQRAAEARNLDVWTPPTVNSIEAQARLASLAADLLVVCDYGEILKPQTLATATRGGINLHASLLPKYRGAAPVQWALLHGEAETGISVIHMTPGLDAGPILMQQRTPIDPDEDAEELEERLARMGADAVLEGIDRLESGTARAMVQDARQASKAPRLKKEQGAIDWSQSCQEIKNQVRAFRPWPRAYTFWRRPQAEPLRLNIDRVSIFGRPVASTAVTANPPPGGAVLDCTPRLIVATGNGALAIDELQPAGKRSMTAADFVRGYRIQPGEHLETA